MQSLDSKKSGLFKVLMSIVFFFMFIEFRAWLGTFGFDQTTLKGTILILLSAIVISIACFFIILSTKIYDNKIILTTKTKIFLVIFAVVVFLFLLLNYEAVVKVFSTDKMIVLIALLGALQPGIIEEFIVRGLMFCVIRIKFNGLALCVLIHTIIDFHPEIKVRGNETSSWVGILIVFIPILLISLKCLFQLNADYQKSIIETSENQVSQETAYQGDIN